MDLNKVNEKAKELLNKLTEGLKTLLALPGKLFVRLSSIFKPLAFKTSVLKPGIFTSWKEKIASFFSRILETIRSRGFLEGKRRTVFFAAGGATIFLFILLIILLAVNSSGPKKSAPADMSSGPVIPAEDLFIPREPDFLPGFLMEREPRSSWSLDDIRPYWRSPANAEPWRGELKSAVDKIMEGIP